MDSEYDENIFVKIVLNSTDCLLIGLLYRTPTERLDGIDDYGNLNKLITEASNKKFSHILLMGNINYPDVDCKCYRKNSDSVETADYKFLQCIRDNVLYQHVTKPTRFRGNDNPNVLDLIFTNEEDPASTLRIHNVAVWLLFGQVPFLRENYVATTYFRYVICKSL